MEQDAEARRLELEARNEANRIDYERREAERKAAIEEMQAKLE